MPLLPDHSGPVDYRLGRQFLNLVERVRLPPGLPFQRCGEADKRSGLINRDPVVQIHSALLFPARTLTVCAYTVERRSEHRRLLVRTQIPAPPICGDSSNTQRTDDLYAPDDGLIVQGEDTAFAAREFGFESRSVHQFAPVVYDG